MLILVYIYVCIVIFSDLNVASVEESDICSICLENFDGEVKQLLRYIDQEEHREPTGCVLMTPCNHQFDDVCLVEWMKRDASCPLCRKSLFDSDPVLQRSFLHRRILKKYTDLEDRPSYRLISNVLPFNSKSIDLIQYMCGEVAESVCLTFTGLMFIFLYIHEGYPIISVLYLSMKLYFSCAALSLLIVLALHHTYLSLTLKSRKRTKIKWFYKISSFVTISLKLIRHFEPILYTASIVILLYHLAIPNSPVQ